MIPRVPFATRRLCARLQIGAAAVLIMLTPVLVPVARAESPTPGGLLESATSTGVRPTVAVPMPVRGKFTFPAPYNTTGIRLTNPADCGSAGKDCVNDIGYAYWRNSNNHVGSDTMLIVVTLDRARGGNGPTLFGYDKNTDAVTVLGPLFDATSPLSWYTGEGWYFSATKPHALYVNDSQKLYRYDVINRTLETVFDVASFEKNRYIWQTNSSDDDDVHSATLRANDTFAMLGCLVYRESTKEFSYFPATGDFDECQVDRSGGWLLIKENVDGVAGEDNRIIDLRPTRFVFLDQQGAAGHSDNGYGYMVALDNWSPVPGAVRVWTFGVAMPGLPPQGRLVYRTTDWSLDAGHISHTNARPDVPVEEQYACAAQGTRVVGPRANEVVCFRLDDSLQVLVVAPTMTNLDAAGGGTEYAKLPKGNLDVTGRYFIWSSNRGGQRLDAFVVKVPSGLLGGGPVPPDETPPVVTLTTPTSGAHVHGTVVLAVNAADNIGVAGVRYKLSGALIGAEVTTPPFSLAWDTTATADGVYTVKAVARDAAGNSIGSPGVAVTVSNGRVQVMWTRLVNATAIGGKRLSKTGGCDGCADAGAVSAQTIADDGYLEFRATETSSLRLVGLGKSGPGTVDTPITFGVLLKPGGIAEVHETGASRAQTTYASGDVFRIAIAGADIVYTKNSALIYRGVRGVPKTLRVRASLYSTPSTITAAVVSIPW